MKILIPVPQEQYMIRLKSKLERGQTFGRERFSGYCGKKYFYISYHSGEEMGRGRSSIFTSAVGSVREEDGQSAVSYRILYGLTDPINFVLLLILSCILFFFVRIPHPMMYGFWTAMGGAAFTFICSAVTSTGKRNAKAMHNLFAKLFPQ